MQSRSLAPESVTLSASGRQWAVHPDGCNRGLLVWAFYPISEAVEVRVARGMRSIDTSFAGI